MRRGDLTYAAASVFTHGLLVGAMAWGLAHDGAHVAGAPGLAGNPNARFDVTMEAAPPPAPAPRAVKAAPVTEGLPVDVKHEHPREIETPPERPAERVAENAVHGEAPSDAPKGAPGQGGTGSEAADRVGDSDRTNRLGIYLQKMQRKIQSNLGSAGYLEFPAHAKLLLDLKRDGSVTKIAVVESSGDAALDRLAIRAVQKSLPFDPWEVDQRVEVPVLFRGGG